MLYIIKNKYFLIDYIIDNMQNNESIKVIELKRSRKGLSKVIRYIDYVKGNKASNKYFQADFLKELEVITPQDKVLFFGVENQKDLLLLIRNINTKNICVWLWNSIHTITKGVIGVTKYTDSLKSHGIRLYTFDKGNAKKYNINYLEQVYIKPKTQYNTTPKNDIYFVGTDKGRKETIITLANKFAEMGLRLNINILNTQTNNKNINNLSSPIDYEQSLVNIANSKIILDIVQKGQEGNTLRPLEAIFMDRKLITNDITVKEQPFYNSNNIFIIGVDKWEDINNFIQKPYIPIKEEILEKYDINNWIRFYI